MKKYFYFILLSLFSFAANSQALQSQIYFAPSVASIDYSTLYSSFDKLFIIPDGNCCYKDLARTQVAQHGDSIKSITELVDGDHLQWGASSNRLSFLDTDFGSRYRLLYPLYHRPYNDVAHVSFSNMFDSFLQSATFTALSSPNTGVFVIRSRRAVGDEGGVAIGVGARDRSQDHLEISNNAGSVELDAASGVPNYDRISILMVVDNGANSIAYLNNSALGTVKTLSASSITSLFYGTTSHIWEHDVVLAGVINSALSTGDRNTLYTALTGFWTPDERPQAPHTYDIVVGFDGTDTFSVSGSSFFDPYGLSEDTGLRQYEWFVTDTENNINGNNGLDTQYPVSRASTFKRGNYPNVFRTREGASNIGVVVRIKSFNTNGQSWAGTPHRSLSLLDNITGTPVTTGQAWVTSVTVENSTPDIIDVDLTSTTGGGTYSGGNVDHFHVIKNGVEVSKTIDLTDLASGTVHLDLVDNLTYSDDIVVYLIPGTTTPLQNSLGFTVPQFTTGVYIPFTNNITGPITMKVNLSWFVDGTSPPWVNLNADGSVSTIDADVADESGNATGIALDVTESYQGWTSSDYGSAGTLFNETNVTARGLGVWQGGNTNGTLQFSGLSSGQTFDISYAIAKTGNGGAGTVTVTNGASNPSTAFDSSTYTEFTRTSQTADASGNIDITMTITGSGDEAAMIGIILTVYP